MYELTIKNELWSFQFKKRYSALSCGKVVASIVNSTDNETFRFNNRAYKVEFNDGQTMEFVQKSKLGIGSVEYTVYQDETHNEEYSVYQDKELLGTISKETLKSKYRLQINGTGSNIAMGNFLERSFHYTDVLENTITIQKGTSPLSRWKVTSESEITQVDIAVILFLRAMTELIQ